MEIRIKVHSMIDVITNSSTETYTFTSKNSVANAHEMVNEVLRVCGSDKKSEDLFEIKIKMDDLKYHREDFKESCEDELGADEFEEGFREYLDDMNEGAGCPSTLSIVPKDDTVSTKDIFGMIEKLTYSESISC